MANVSITALTAYADAASTDVLPIVDVGANITKKISISDILKATPAGTAALPAIAIDGDPNTGIWSPAADTLALSTGGVERVRWDSSGRMLIGATSQGAFTSALTLSYDSGTTKWSTGPYSGNAGGYVISANTSYGVYLASTTSTSWATASDERLKTDFLPIESALEKISTLRAVTGRYKADKDGPRKAFLIAQDVLEVLPEAVDTSNPNRYGLAYAEVIPLLVAALKESKLHVEALEARITTLEGAS